MRSDAAALGSFDVWVGPYWRDMAMFARRLVGEPDWEDVAQEAVSAAWRKWEQYDDSRGSPQAWLLAIVADQAAKHRRKHRRQSTAGTVGQTGVGTERAEDRLDVEAALKTLTVRQCQAVTLYYFLDLPLADIATVMDCRVGTVKSTLRDARARLRPILGEQ